jgi:hypothetical protein
MATAPTTVLQEINALYIALYGRLADSIGIDYWVGQLQLHNPAITPANAAGFPISQADSAFLGLRFLTASADASNFFNSLYTNLNDLQFVQALYQNIGGNAGDPGGIQFWFSQLQALEATNTVANARAQIAGQFADAVLDFDLTPGAAALGLSAVDYANALARQASFQNKVSVSQFYADESRLPTGGFLNAPTTASPAFAIERALVLTVTNDPATVAAAKLAIQTSAVAGNFTAINALLPAAFNITDNVGGSVPVGSTTTGGAINEGGTITYTIHAPGVPDGTILTYSFATTPLINGTTTNAIGQVTSPHAGVLTVINGTAFLTISTSANVFSPGDQALQLVVTGAGLPILTDTTIVHENAIGNFNLTGGTDNGAAFTAQNVANGGLGGNSFVATDLTLGQNDSLTGSFGTFANNNFDQLFITTTGAPVILTGFTTTGIARYNVNASALTTIDMSSAFGVQTVVDNNSFHSLTLTNVLNANGGAAPGTLPTMVISNTSDFGFPVDLTVNYQAAVVVGNSIQNVTLNNVLSPVTGYTNTLLTANGVEAFNVLSNSGAVNGLTGIVSNVLNNVTLTGGSTFVLGGTGLAFVGASTLDLTGFTGANFFNTGPITSTGALTVSTGSAGMNSSFTPAVIGGVPIVSGVITAAGTLQVNMGSGSLVNQFLTSTGGSITITPTGGSTAGSLTGSATTFGGNITINASINGGIGAPGNFFVVSDGGGNTNVTGGIANDFLDFQAGFNAGDTFNAAGGVGDQLDVNANSLGGTASNLEIVNINSGNFGNGTGSIVTPVAINFANFGSSLTTINVNVNVNSPDFLNLTSGQTVNIDNAFAGLTGGAKGTLAFDFNNAPANGSQTLNLNLTNAAGANLTVQDFDNSIVGNNNPIGTFNFSAIGGGTATLAFSNLNNMTTFGIGAGNTNLTIGPSVGTASINTVAGASYNANANLTNLAALLNPLGSSITLGNGNNTIQALTGTNTITVGSGNNNIIGGAGVDTVNLNTGNPGAGTGFNTVTGGFGADVFNINTGVGGANTFVYTTVFDSTGVVTDTLNNFRSGTDSLNLLAALQTVNPNITSSLDLIFWGNAPSTAAALAQLTLGAPTGFPQAVYDDSTNTLLVDGNGDGLISGLPNDMTIVINTTNELTDLQAADLGTQSSLIFLAGVGPFNTTVAANNVFGTNANTNGANHLIIATAAQLQGSTITPGNPAGGGSNILVVTTPMATAANFDFNVATTTTNIQRLELFAGSGPFNVIAPNISGLIIDLGAATVGAGLTTGNTGINPGQIVNGSAGGDTINLSNTTDVAHGNGGIDDIRIAVNNFAGTVTGDAGNDFVEVFATLAAAANINGGGQPGDELQLHNGANISAGTVAGFDHATLDNGGTAEMTVAQHNAFPGGIVAPGNETIVLDGTGALTGDADVESWILTNASTFTLGAVGQNVQALPGVGAIVDIAGFSPGGTLTGSSSFGNNTLRVSDGGFHAFGGTVTSFEFVSLLNGSVLVLTDSQVAAMGSAQWSGTNTGETVVLFDTATTVVNFGQENGAPNGAHGVANLEINAANLAAGDDVQFNAITGSTVLVDIGDSNLNQATNFGLATGTGAVTVQQFTSVAGQIINTGNGADTINVDDSVVGTDTHINTGGGNDTVAFTDTGGVNFTLSVLDIVDGGAGTDTLHYYDNAGATDDLGNVSNFETVVFDNGGVINEAITNTTTGANGHTVTFNVGQGVNGTFNAVAVLNFNAVTTGAVVVNLTETAGAVSFLFAANTASQVDVFNFGSGADTLFLGPANTVANIATADQVSNFDVAGFDVIGGTGGAVATFTINLASTTAATFAGDVNTQLFSNGIVLTGNELILVNVLGGSLAGLYGLDNNAGGATTIDAPDAAIKFVGTTGFIDHTHFA